jgi:hypothetical protein
MESEQIFRVTVRGRFGQLSPATKVSLVAALDDHDVTRSAFTREGTLTYDAHIGAFGLRYEIRLPADQPEEMAGQVARREAESFLSVMGFPHGELRVSTTAMASMWHSSGA